MKDQWSAEEVQKAQDVKGNALAMHILDVRSDQIMLNIGCMHICLPRTASISLAYRALAFDTDPMPFQHHRNQVTAGLS